MGLKDVILHIIGNMVLMVLCTSQWSTVEKDSKAFRWMTALMISNMAIEAGAKNGILRLMKKLWNMSKNIQIESR